MSASPNSEQNEQSSQAGQEMPAANEPTAQDIRRCGTNELFGWIQRKLAIPLKPEDEEKFVEGGIEGEVFLDYAGDKDFFISAGFNLENSHKLAKLAREIIG